MTGEGQWILNGVTAAAFQEGQARIQYNWLGALWLPRLWLPKYPTFETKLDLLLQNMAGWLDTDRVQRNFPGQNRFDKKN